MKHRIDIKGVIIPNDYKDAYDWFGMDATCPKDVQTVLNASVPGDDVDIYINSNGGEISSGSEIYTMLKSAGTDKNVTAYITGAAHSAASIIACSAGKVCMSPTALMMVHCVSSYASGNHNDMEHTAEVLREADEALCTAYMSKAGMTREEAIDMMEHETWMNAETAKAKGLVDEIMFEKSEGQPMAAAFGFHFPTAEQIESIKAIRQVERIKAIKDATITSERKDSARAVDNLRKRRLRQIEYLRLSARR